MVIKLLDVAYKITVPLNGRLIELNYNINELLER